MILCFGLLSVGHTPKRFNRMNFVSLTCYHDFLMVKGILTTSTGTPLYQTSFTKLTMTNIESILFYFLPFSDTFDGESIRVEENVSKGSSIHAGELKIQFQL